MRRNEQALWGKPLHYTADDLGFIVNILIQIPLAKQTSTPQMPSGIGMKNEGEHGRILSMPSLSKKDQMG